MTELVLPGLGSVRLAPQLSAGSSFPLQFLLTTLGSSLESAEQEEEERLANTKGRRRASKPAAFLCVRLEGRLGVTSENVSTAFETASLTGLELTN